VSINGEATPSPADDRKKQFGKEALVEWKMVIGDEEISEAEIARAEEVGATLLHTGHRWVRIDADELRRKRAKLTELQTTKAVVTPIELLRLANDENSAGSGSRRRLDGEGARSPCAATTVRPTDADWVRNLLAGLPDERLDETHESASSSASCATTSAGRCRGCSSSPSSASAAASPTTWASARPPPPSPTSSNDPARTSWCARSASCATGARRRLASRRSSTSRSTTAPTGHRVCTTTTRCSRPTPSASS
jgi:hypothetical protein